MAAVAPAARPRVRWVDPGRAGATERVIVLDLGAQYTLLIARRVRELGVYCEILPAETPVATLRAARPAAIVLSGGPSSVYEPEALRVDPGLWDLGVPTLGICYGMQLMAHELGGQVAPGPVREFGRSRVVVRAATSGPTSALFSGIGDPGTALDCWMSHGDAVMQAPPGFRPVAESPGAPVAAMEWPERGLYGVQFHPEVAHTPFGPKLLSNFLFGVAGLRGGWSMASFAEEAVAQLRELMPEGDAVVAISGGVDSATAAVLAHRAIGRRLHAIFVDHGLLRQGEAEEVQGRLGKLLADDTFRAVDARAEFLRALSGVDDPEAKRRIVGREFIRVFEAEARRLPDVRYLVQGTLYPDVVESGGGRTATIKSHHNVGGLPDEMALTVIEPLRFLFKDEVRRLGEALGLPEGLVHRQPFPGPGLAVRVVGPVTPEALEVVRRADAILRDELQAAGLSREIWQAFAVWTGSSSVGVKGDRRAYGPVIALRCVTSQDGMTADWARVPYEVLDRISHRITNEVPSVSRVVYDISPKPPATIEWE